MNPECFFNDNAARVYALCPCLALLRLSCLFSKRTSYLLGDCKEQPQIGGSWAFEWNIAVLTLAIIVLVKLKESGRTYYTGTILGQDP